MSTFVPLTTEEEVVSAHRAGLLVWKGTLAPVSGWTFNRNTLTDALVFRDWGVLLEEDED